VIVGGFVSDDAGRLAGELAGALGGGGDGGSPPGAAAPEREVVFGPCSGLEVGGKLLKGGLVMS